MLVTLFLVVTFTAAVFLALRRLSQYPGRGILNVGEFLRGGNPQKIRAVLNEALESELRLGLTRHEFLPLQRKNLHSVLEFLLCMFHDTRVCIELAHNEQYRELVRHPGMADGEEYVQRAKKLECAAFEFRTYCFLAIMRVRFWIAFRTQWWLPFPAPRISDLKQIYGLSFFTLYNKFIQAVSDVGLLHGPEFQESFLKALIKSDPLDEQLGR